MEWPLLTDFLLYKTSTYIVLGRCMPNVEAASPRRVIFRYLAAIAALYVAISVGRSVGWLVGRLVGSNKFQGVKNA